MHPALALWAFAAAVVPVNEAALSRRSSASRTHSSSHRTHRTGLLLRKTQLPVADELDVEERSRSDVAKFGPDNCVSTWRNEDGHCEVETKCKENAISKYAVKFICIDAGGEKVRHVFSAGSFDSEEQFDTLIECKKCLAEKEDTVEIEYDLPTKHGDKGKDPQSQKLEDKELGGSPLIELREEVKALEGFLTNTSAALQKLNAKVYGANSKQYGVSNAAPKAASSLVHRTSIHHHHEAAAPLRVEAEAAQVKKIHKGALRPSHPSHAIGAVQEEDDAEEEGDEEATEMSIPQSADEMEQQEEGETARPSIATLQRGEDDDDDDDGDGGADGED